MVEFVAAHCLSFSWMVDRLCVLEAIPIQQPPTGWDTPQRLA